MFLISREVANLVGESYHSLESQRGREIARRNGCDCIEEEGTTKFQLQISKCI